MNSPDRHARRPTAHRGAGARRRLLLVSAGFLLLLLLFGWYSEASKRLAAANVARLASAAVDAREVSNLTRSVNELQRHVLVFRLTGNAAVTGRIARLHAELTETGLRLEETVGDEQRRERLHRMRDHLDAYHQNFAVLVANRRRIDTLARTELPEQQSAISALIDDIALGASSAGQPVDTVLQLRTAFDGLSSALLRFVVDPYSVQAGAVTDSLDAALARVAELAAGRNERTRALETALTAFERDFNLFVQLLRGDLQLANVVMAGSADEISRLGDELAALSEEALRDARYAAEAEIRSARSVYLVIVALVILFAAGLVWTTVRATRRLAEVEDGLRESRQRFRATFEQAAVGIAHVGTDGRFLRVNRRLCDIVGYAPDELVALTFQDITHPDDLDADVNNVRQVLAGEIDTYTMEKRYIRKDGSLVWIDLTVSLVKDDSGEPKYFISVIEEITQRKRDELRLRRSREALARSNAELEQFAYVASHDLQEPLRMVSSYLQLLEKRYKGRLDEEADEFIHYAVDGAQRMKALINGLLSLSRVKTRGDPFAEVEMRAVLEHALKNLEASIGETGATVTHGELPYLPGDAVQLEQLLQNLIGNAIKYRGESLPAIHVSAERIEDTDIELPEGAGARGWLFAVRDNGIGIPPESAEEVFRIFRRLHGVDEHGGTGIGLAVCSKIVERHGGRIWVESAGENGSVFYFTLVREEPAP